MNSNTPSIINISRISFLNHQNHPCIYKSLRNVFNHTDSSLKLESASFGFIHKPVICLTKTLQRVLGGMWKTTKKKEAKKTTLHRSAGNVARK